MHLELEPDGELVLKQPLDDLARLNSAEYWRKQYGPAAIAEVELSDPLTRPKIILPRPDDELDLVVLGEMRNVFIPVSFHLAASGRLEIHYSMDARINPGNVMGSAGLDQHSLPQITQLFHQRQDVLLEQRFTSGYFHQRTIEG